MPKEKKQKIINTEFDKPEALNEQRIRDIIREELSDMQTVERYTFQKHLQLFDGRNIQAGRETGTKIGTEGYIDANDEGQKLGFYGTTPIIQPDTITDPSITTVSGSGDDATINSNFTNLKASIDAIIDALQSVGLMR